MPGPTDEPGEPTETPGPEFVVDIAAPLPPDPIPAPWVGVIDFLRQNVCVSHGGTTVCEGDWIANTNPSLFENRVIRREDVDANLVAEGDMRPDNPADDVHVARPRCLLNGEWWYVPGAWYYNGTSSAVVDEAVYRTVVQHYGPPEVPREEAFDVLVRYHYAHVPEPAYPGATAWNFGASGECKDLGGGGGGPTPTPPPPPPTFPPVPVDCPSCALSVSPLGAIESPYLVPSTSVTLTWVCSYPSGDLTGYSARIWSYNGTQWSVVDQRDLTENHWTVEVLSGFLYRAQVSARFDVGGEEQDCCSAQTYYRYSLEFTPPSLSPEARADYWSRDDPGSSPEQPRHTTGAVLAWPWGQFLNIHPTAAFTLTDPGPDWQAQVRILRWRYRGSLGQEVTTAWYEETDPPQYIHLLWTRYPHTTTLPDTWIYASEPQTVDVTYDLEVELILTYVPTGQEVRFSPLAVPGLVLHVPLVYQYQTAPQ